MRKLTFIIIVAVLAWGGYWFAGSTALERGMGLWFDQRRATGWQAEYTSLATSGFPNRFDTTIKGLTLADPETGLAWSAPFFQILALSYNPGHIIVVWPETQTIATPTQRITVTADTMRGSAVFNETTDLNLNRTSIILEGLGLSSNNGWANHLEHGQLAMRQIEGSETAYELHFDAKGITPASDFIKRFENVALLSDVITGMDITANITFDAPWDRFAIERARPQITQIDLDLLQANWGQLDLQLAGLLEIDAQGVPSGQITVKAKNWREMLALAHQGGLVPSALLPTITDALSFLAALSGNKSTIDTPLTFRNGFVAFGPIPLGPAPNFSIP